MTDITIPPESLKDVARVLHDHAEIFDDLSWEDLSEDDQEAYIEEARSVCRAMLKAWPGVYPVSYGGDEPPFIVLPLPTESSND
jgi:hypothetical protein